MKVSMEFNLPEEQTKWELALNAKKMYQCLEKISEISNESVAEYGDNGQVVMIASKIIDELDKSGVEF